MPSKKLTGRHPFNSAAWVLLRSLAKLPGRSREPTHQPEPRAIRSPVARCEEVFYVEATGHERLSDGVGSFQSNSAFSGGETTQDPSTLSCNCTRFQMPLSLPCARPSNGRIALPSLPSLGVPDGGEGARGRAWLRPWRQEMGDRPGFPDGAGRRRTGPESDDQSESAGLQDWRSALRQARHRRDDSSLDGNLHAAWSVKPGIVFPGGFPCPKPIGL